MEFYSHSLQPFLILYKNGFNNKITRSVLLDSDFIDSLGTEYFEQIAREEDHLISAQKHLIYANLLFWFDDGEH